MLVKEKNNPILNVWADTPINQERIQKWGFEIYTGETETGYNGLLYVKGQAPAAATKSYIEKRQEAYPSIEEQLDMIYWDKVNGTNLWQQKIAEIKAKYPKE